MAQKNLGVIFYDNKYKKQNFELAERYFLQSANQNLSNAQKNLGLFYYTEKKKIKY